MGPVVLADQSAPDGDKLRRGVSSAQVAGVRFQARLASGEGPANGLRVVADLGCNPPSP
jgi:hypothetical protein